MNENGARPCAAHGCRLRATGMPYQITVSVPDPEPDAPTTVMTVEVPLCAYHGMEASEAQAFWDALLGSDGEDGDEDDDEEEGDEEDDEVGPAGGWSPNVDHLDPPAGVGPAATPHRQVRLSHGDWAAEVDEGIAELIRLLWSVGVQTISSCQGVPGGSSKDGFAYIEFDNSKDAERFLALAQRDEPRDLDEHGEPRWWDLGWRMPGLTTHGQPWLWTPDHPGPDDPRNWVIHTWTKWEQGYGAWIRVHVRFPGDDLPRVAENVRQSVAQLPTDSRLLSAWRFDPRLLKRELAGRS